MDATLNFRQCAFCGRHEAPAAPGFVKYSTRRYAHADCLLRAKGAAAFDCFADLSTFPADAAHRAGLDDVLAARLEGRKS